MPVLEGLQVSAESKAIARQAHLQRTRDRIATWKVKLSDPVLKEAERLLIEEELGWYERQLLDPVTRRTLRVTPEGPVPMRDAGEVDPDPMTDLVLSLKAELHALKAQFTGKGADAPTPVSKSPAAPNA